MGGFSPTLEQVARLFGLSKDEGSRILRLLVHEGVLYHGPGGRYRLMSNR
jgi:DNA-binding IclR family transcriptional regulator